MNAPLTAKDFATNRQVRSLWISVLSAVAIAFLFFTSPSVGADTSIASPPQDICLNKKTLTGCCSGRIGVLGVTQDGVMCLNGELSPTCTQNVEAELGGCCSHNDGVFFIDRDTGDVICKNGNVSPTCSATINACTAPPANEL